MNNGIAWEVRSLLDLAVISSGAAPPTLRGTVLVMGANGPIGTTSRANFGPGYLVGRVGTAGAVNYMPTECWASDNTLTVQPRVSVCDAAFLGHLLSFLRLERLATKNAQPLITQSSLGSVRVVIPLDILEQRAIARVLDAIDAVIVGHEQLMDKLLLIKQGLLEDLLARGIGESGGLRPDQNSDQFYDTSLGRIPKEWEVRCLADWVRPDVPITYGIVQAGPHIPEGVPYIRTGDMAGDDIQLENLLRTSRRVAKAYKRSEVRHGDIVFAIRATVGKVLPVPLELDGANLTQGTARIAPGSGVHGQYLLWALRSDAVQRQVRKVQKGTTFSEITLGQLKSLQVACPRSLNEQKAIAGVLAAWETRLKSEQAQLSKLRQIRQGLMDDLLTGRVRVPIPEEAAK